MEKKRTSGKIRDLCKQAGHWQHSFGTGYLQWEKLPAGLGYADLTYLPKRDSDWPTLAIELKRNESAEGEIAQTERKYPGKPGKLQRRHSSCKNQL